MGWLVIHPGHFTTVQDRGRHGFREWGVPTGGAFDLGAFELANALLGNPEDCAALELTWFGGLYEARQPLALALAGAPMEAAVLGRDGRERSLAVPASFSLRSGDRLRLGGTPSGLRTYLAVRGGFQTVPRLGSRSEETRIEAGMVLPAEPGWTPARRPADPGWSPPNEAPVRVLDGPDASWGVELGRWLASDFRVGRETDRMGLRLEGPPLTVRLPTEPLSRPVSPGAIQVAGGQMIVLGVASGTMGGYPHVAHVISADLDRIGQLRAGDRVAFRRVGLAEARALGRARRDRNAERFLRLAALAGDLLAETAGSLGERD